MPSAHEFLRLCPRSKMTMLRMCTCPTRHFRLDAKTRDPPISHRRATVQTYQMHGSMSQQSARLDAESALNKRQPGVSSSNGGQCYAQYLVVYGPKGLPRITVMRILLAMLMTPAIACEPPSFPTSGSPETHLTSPSRNLVHGQRFAFSKHQSKKCGRDVQPRRLPMRLGKNRWHPSLTRKFLSKLTQFCAYITLHAHTLPISFTPRNQTWKSCWQLLDETRVNDHVYDQL